MARLGGTGVQPALNRAVFELLERIVVYPVEDETHFMDGRGRTLPDAFLMRSGATPRDLAFAVHTDIGKGFLYAVVMLGPGCGSGTHSPSRTATSSGSSRPQNKQCGIFL